ncbi:nitrogenase stabilizing/protective protein NifW [Rhizobium grahamii]|uniref:Nitrogenase-stabilizing/protective protein NifW n=1 Tax=Rhizobium grahamii TaxID=1120045 RepID=A0A370KEJ8_9HYPH|nr:nitrogenase stabilizing/protective protein NifW [Rhizobium grahamii]RDJ01994.1 nitrogen fixation protein NifW [Rhizobium grahamii]
MKTNPDNSRPISVVEVLSQLRNLSAAEDFFETLGVAYERRVLETSRLHIMKRMGQYLADEDLEDVPQELVAARARATLKRAYEDFVTSAPLHHRVFKVLQDHDPLCATEHNIGRNSTFVLFESVLKRFGEAPTS